MIIKEPVRKEFLPSGQFTIGCNYWASHAGTAMWSDWRPDVVEADLRQLSAEGMELLRIFTLWPDFQPLYRLDNHKPELWFGETLRPDTDAGRAGVSEVALERFQVFADLAEKHKIKLLVGLVTGWMSGRLFVPPAFVGRNPLTDPLARQWQIRLVRCLVRRFKGHPAIAGWDLGNECNCMAEVNGNEDAWNWTAAIAAAIRLEDSTLPVVSGMHSLNPSARAHWRMQDQGELTDVLTTHPYPFFTPHCLRDPVTTIRTSLHAVAESRFYGDIGGKPCFAEEFGTLGPMVASEATAAAFARTVLYSLWVNDCRAQLWWCAYDQYGLQHAPYANNGCELELGLIDGDRRVKPIARAMKATLAAIRQALPAGLPRQVRHAVCILSEEQDQWGAAYSSFILAAQAGFSLEFQFGDQPLKPANLYLVPSLSGSRYFPQSLWLALLDRVDAGAVLYVSSCDAFIARFKDTIGLEVLTREQRSGSAEIQCKDGDGEFRVSAIAGTRLTFSENGAEVLARETDGNPAWVCKRRGKGQIHYLSVPVEVFMANTPGAFHQEAMGPIWRVYRQVAAAARLDRVISKDNPFVGITEHPDGATTRIAVLINYSPTASDLTLTLARGWRVAGTLIGGIVQDNRFRIPANDALVIKLESDLTLPMKNLNKKDNSK